MTLYKNRLSVLGQWYDPNIPDKKTTKYRYILEDINFKGFVSVSNRPSKDGKYRTGFWFVSAKEVWEHIPGDSAVVYLGKNKQYDGAFVAYGVVSTLQPPTGWQDPTTNLENLEEKGAEAWNLLRPDLPDFSFAQSALELKDFINPLKNRFKSIRSKVAKEQARRKAANRSLLSKAGQHWLSIQFGYLPLLSDTLDFIQKQKSAQGRVEQLIRDAGRPVRRRREMNKHSKITSLAYLNSNQSTPYHSMLVPTFTTGCYTGGRASHSQRQGKAVRMWCEGRFRYWLPPGPKTVQYKRRLFRRVMGMYLDINTLYNLVPWTWLVDYFTDLGEFVQATSSGVADRLAADYCYVMCETTWITELYCTQYVRTGANGTSKAVTGGVRRTFTVKTRAKGTPFGWGVKSSDLSPMQLSILGALGASKLS